MVDMLTRALVRARAIGDKAKPMGAGSKQARFAMEWGRAVLAGPLMALAHWALPPRCPGCAEPVEADQTERFKGLLEYLKKTLPEIGDVRLSRRLKESAACLVAPEGGMSAHMERLLQRMGRDSSGAMKRILEINPDHAAVASLRDLFERSPEDPRLETYARLLLDQAILAEGSKLNDPTSLAHRINELIARDAKQ